VNTDFADLPEDMDAYDQRTWRVFCVLIVVLFVTGVTAWGLLP